MRFGNLLVGTLALGAAAGLLAPGRGTRAQRDDAAKASTESEGTAGPSIEVGEYIVHHVAMCVQCHTPRNEDHTLDRHRLLRGAAIPVKPPYPDQTWAYHAPKIAGLPGGWTEDDTVHFLKTGKSPTGHAARAPMPPFRMTEEHARSVALYLESLQD